MGKRWIPMASLALNAELLLLLLFQGGRLSALETCAPGANPVLTWPE